MPQEYEIDQHTISVHEQGAGAPLLFVHGFPLDHTMWQFQIAKLSEAYHVIAPDLRGFGKSTSSDEQTTMADYADDLAALLVAMNISERVTLCGLSMGGYIALEFTRRHPEKLARLILCDTKASPDDVKTQDTRHEVASKVLAEGPEFLAEGLIKKLFAPLTLETSPAIIKQTHNVITGSAPQAIAAASRGMAARTDMRSRLSEIDVPTLVICGADDAIVTVDEMRGMAKEIPTAQFALIEGAGHMAPLEQPAAVNEVILHFLAETDV